MTPAQSGQPSSFWLTNRGVVATGFLVLELVFFATDSVGVPAHAYVSGDVGGTPYLAGWFSHAFLIPAALIMPLLGSLRERVGAKAIATVGPGLFGVACLISAMATDPQLFIAMRVLQGLGAGVIPAAAGGYLGGQLGEKYTPMGKGLVALALVTGSSAGIPFSGFITWYFSWRVLYGVLGLTALVAVAVIARLMPATPGNPQAEIDWLGYGLMAGGFGLLAVSLVVGNQQEWFQSSTYVVMLWSALLLIGLFAWRAVAVPKLINLRIFQDINYCISVVNLSSVMFFLFMMFAIVPRFLTVALGNTIATYSWSFVPFVGTAVLTAVMVTPGVSPHLIAARIPAKKKLCATAILLFALTALWMAHTSAQQNNANLTIQLMAVGTCFALINCLEIQMSFSTMAPELMTSASSVLFFCANISKALSGGVSAAILTVTSQGSWDRFRERISSTSPAMEAFQQPLSGHSAGISGDTWSQGSLELINKATAQQVEVVAFINIATLVGLALLALCALPLLHRSPGPRR
ncbi:MFS transporter [Synechococcus sp. CCY9201]|uniref:MFS transporter n=1 Tax=unclassified Synechococcus TaxID=2626047 RepID=UPI002AD42F61|nr:MULTISPECIES: MFS transporter [unclassified Synechococcus]MEA5424235.1 MFS transporter [Synechococcus sp. CCY9202]MEA5473804.1 MFS transporter [Synechococcus sp. CCY9201]CAK6690808.1 putative multidrug resistance protein EmrY [Synechococcus sp. CBW1107]